MIRPSADRLATIEGTRPFWPALAQLLPILALMLPVAGVVARWTSFVFDRSVPAQAILAASVPELAATGFAALWPAITLVAFALFAARRPDAPVPSDPKAAAQLRSVAIWTIRIMYVPFVILLIYMVLEFDFPAGWLYIGSSLVLGNSLSRLRVRKGQRIPLSALLLPALVLVVLSAIASGIAPNNVPEAQFVFAADVNLSDGRYRLLGQTDELLYLRPCGSSGDTGVLMVPRSGLKYARFVDRQPRVPVTLPDIVLRGKPLRFGLSAVCD